MKFFQSGLRLLWAVPTGFMGFCWSKNPMNSNELVSVQWFKATCLSPIVGGRLSRLSLGHFLTHHPPKRSRLESQENPGPITCLLLSKPSQRFGWMFLLIIKIPRHEKMVNVSPLNWESEVGRWWGFRFCFAATIRSVCLQSRDLTI